MSSEGQEKITEKDILDSLHRSGYLFESEITKRLADVGFFVESNVTSLDPITGKNREIDLIAEYRHEFDEEKSKNKILSLAKFVFEIKNNNSPFVLMTKHEYSPNSEIYNGLKVAQTIPDFLKNVYFAGFYEVLFYGEPEKDIYTQYCSFSKKKNEELMAHHPDNIYSAFQKITHFCEENVDSWVDYFSKNKDSYFRSVLYLPILLIKEDLYELQITADHENKLQKVECSRLVFNYHYKQKPKTSTIHVVTRKGLKELLKEVLAAEETVEKNMIASKAHILKKAEQEKKE
jgi:hypothetical protein